MTLLKQISAVTAMNLKSVPQRIGSSLVIVIGIAGVVGVLVSVGAMVRGLGDTLISSGNENRAIVLRNGATSEISSVLSPEATATILNAPGIARTPDGEAAVTTDMIIAVNLEKKEGGLGALTVRGMSPEGFTVRPEIELVAGRMFEPGLREAIVGRNAQIEYQGLEIGDRVELRSSVWTIVGVFRSGDSFESGILTDVDTLLSAYQRTQVSSATALLTSPQAFDELKATITTDPTLDVQVLREPDYYRGQSQQVQAILAVVTNVVAAIMALGALFAALNSMYSAVSARTVEIATLRAIGFGSGGVVVSVLAEAMLLALVGALIGAAAAWLLFGGNTISMGNQVASLVFQVRVTPALLGLGILWACAVGFVGGLLPAIRAARLPVATALRAV
ncbi:MAG TPA: ABC transporter permease [Gammaproteobacteria bacterium]